MNPLRLTVFAFAAVAGMAVFAAPGTDPIVGSYAGSTLVHEILTVDSMPGVFDQAPLVHEITMNFADANVVTIDGDLGTGLVGTWKKKGSKYLADVSAAATEQLKVDIADPKAKASAKFKKILHDPVTGLTGKCAQKRSYRFVGILVHYTDNGVFGCTVAP